MAFQKAKFIRNDKNKSFKVQFNPATLSGSVVSEINEQKNQQLDSEELVVNNLGIVSRTLTMTLIFDEYSVGGVGSMMGDDASVKTKVDKFEEFMNANTTISFAWGDILFKGYINNLSVNYDMFSSDGTPIRASVEVSMIEAGTAKEAGFSLGMDMGLLDDFDMGDFGNEEMLMAAISGAIGVIYQDNL